ncbi:type II toxin-antitoxin system antitoxin SocA domain-containing protein [Priestia koreensis]|uniref:type II toxin-antitoxin system antitoxin SocA domain-containing protein n=1 Tax=Priestia koreensis TaxID=284581 RepID=UPI003D00DA53
MPLLKFCVHCFERTLVEHKIVKDKVELHGETITYDAERYLCTKCHQYTDNDELTDRNFKTIYRKYQEKKNMLKSEDFLYIRKDIYQISTRLMAQLVGWSPATISKYENGSLQTKKHDTHFKTYLDPRSMKRAFDNNRDDIDDKPRRELEERLSFLLDTIKSSELLKGLDDRLTLLNIDEIKDEWEMANKESVEKFFIIKGQEFNEDDEDNLRVSPLKLQKLMYFAQGWTHAFTGYDLFEDDFEAWKHGPVIPDLYYRYKSYGSNRINENLNISVYDLGLTPDQLSILHWIWDKYSKFEAKFLEKLTHIEYPWRKTRVDLPDDASCDWIIEKDDIHHFFDSMYYTLKLLQRN